ncbi:L,D-transpeptidase [Sphingomonas sp. PB2P19]|uniref:L,D-transpeptidase n=1 Tax=Sphingomonas rhamnosi TaxID=3096156 RepID=UPI002FCA2C94
MPADQREPAKVQALAEWTVRTADNQALPFVIVDKVAARLFLFDRHGTLTAESPVLVGRARGDVSPPGIGDRKLSQIPPADRITPAGRFVADIGVNLEGRDVVWVDYDAAVAIHRATDITPGATARDRLARLASASPRDRRVSYGCINVSDAFYADFIRPTFKAGSGIVYILPETGPAGGLFGPATATAATAPAN